MKKLVILPVLILIFLVACKRQKTEPSTGIVKVNHRIQVFTDYQRNFPEAELRDVYKYCFQDKFGAAHIITDSQSCANYIKEEIDKCDTSVWRYDRLYEPLEIYGNYVRVNILAIKQGKITTGQLVSALLRSGTPPDSASLAEWPQEWNKIEKDLHNMTIPFANFKQDSTYIAELFNNGMYVFHHSKRFNQVYHYSYRLIRRDIFEKELLPYLK